MIIDHGFSGFAGPTLLGDKVGRQGIGHKLSTISRLGGSAVIRPIWRPPGGTSRATWGQHSCLGALAATRNGAVKDAVKGAAKTRIKTSGIYFTVTPIRSTHARMNCAISHRLARNADVAQMIGSSSTSTLLVNCNGLRTRHKYTSVTQLPLELHLVFPCLCLLPSLLLPAKASRLHSPSAGKRGPHGALLAEMRTALRLWVLSLRRLFSRQTGTSHFLSRRLVITRNSCLGFLRSMSMWLMPSTQLYRVT